MTEDIENKLRNKWTNILKPHTLIECGNGWYDLIDLACRAINSELVAREKYEEVKYNIVVTEIKEKFGGLRMYYDSFAELPAQQKNTESNVIEDPYSNPSVARGLGIIDGVIRMAELYSYHVCENCGNRGECDPKASYHRTECMACYTMRRDAEDDQYGQTA